jgi:hypothetical protein
MAATADKSKSYIPLAGLADDGWSKEDEASATCFCGAVQLAFVSLPATYARSCSALTLSSCRPANARTRPGEHVRLQLHRLSQDHRVRVDCGTLTTLSR